MGKSINYAAIAKRMAKDENLTAICQELGVEMSELRALVAAGGNLRSRSNGNTYLLIEGEDRMPIIRWCRWHKKYELVASVLRGSRTIPENLKKEYAAKAHSFGSSAGKVGDIYDCCAIGAAKNNKDYNQGNKLRVMIPVAQMEQDELIAKMEAEAANLKGEAKDNKLKDIEKTRENFQTRLDGFLGELAVIESRDYGEVDKNLIHFESLDEAQTWVQEHLGIPVSRF